MQLGIFAPYDHGEVTAGAIRLAGLARSLAYSVSYLSDWDRKIGVHPYWDDCVLKAHADRVHDWANKSLICVWFSPGYASYRYIIEAGAKRKHILVPNWHSFTPETSVAHYDRVVCTSKAMSYSFSQHLQTRGQHLENGVEFAKWTSGVTPMRKRTLSSPGRVRVFVPVGNCTLERHGAELLAVVDALLASEPNIELTLSRQRSGPSLMQSRNRRLCRDYPDRFRECRRLNADEQLRNIHEHDWVWIPDIQSANGLPAQQALSCGVPVIAWDIPPFNEVVKNNWTGKLVPCDTETTWMGAPTAVWSTPALAKVLSSSLHATHTLRTLQDKDWPIREMEEHFSRFWREVLEV